MPDLYAVIGNPISHSKSPLIHAEFSKQTDQDMRYEAILGALDGFSIAVEAFRKFGGRGMNVTIPFKLEACKISTRLTERAAAAQAVNTLVFDNDEILGENTDGIGLVRDIVSNLDFMITGKRVLLMGAGGAARGALLPLLEHQPKTLTIANRTKQKAFELQQRFAEYGCVIPADYVDLAGHEFDIVINSTSASLNGELPSLPPCIFAAESLAYDMMYGSGLTPFLQFAGQQGAVHLSDGIGMLVEQAAESFLLWRGLRPETGPVIAMLRLET